LDPNFSQIPVYAHRLGGEYGPESSMKALRHTLDRGGFDGLEVDVVLSGEGDLIALHDPDLSLSTDGRGWAHETSTSEIRAASLCDPNGEPSNQHPIALAEILDIVPSDLPLQLDVKAFADPNLARITAEACCSLAAGHGTAERIEVLSFNSAAVAAAAARGLDARLILWADYDPRALVRWATRRGLVGVSLDGFILSSPLREPLAQAGLSVSVGAVNGRLELERVLSFNPDILVSDRPDELRRLLGSFH
jgi:glycerophosphoryl diester phosphodiesterase